MKTSPSIFIVVALLAFIASSAPAKVDAKASPVHPGFTEAWRELPQPIVNCRHEDAVLVFELGLRPGHSRNVHTAQPFTLRIIISQSGKAELPILSQFLRLVIPRRSA